MCDRIMVNFTDRVILYSAYSPSTNQNNNGYMTERGAFIRYCFLCLNLKIV